MNQHVLENSHVFRHQDVILLDLRRSKSTNIATLVRDQVLGYLECKNYRLQKPVPVGARSKAWVCGRSPAEIVGSNPTGGMDICLL